MRGEGFHGSADARSGPDHHRPRHAQRILVVCGKGNNGGDGRVAARLLRDRAAQLQEISIDQPPQTAFPPTVIVDAILGTGLSGPARGAALDWIRKINSLRPPAQVVAVDVPSGLAGGGEFVRADLTVTFAAYKVEHFFAPGAEEAVGELLLGDIGVDTAAVACDLETSEARHFAPLAAPRKPASHKGNFGHVLVVGG